MHKKMADVEFEVFSQRIIEMIRLKGAVRV